MATNGGVDGTMPLDVEVAEESFMDKQKINWKEIMRKVEEDARKKKKDWEKEVDRMRIEFLTLYPTDKKWGSEDFVDDPMVYRRRGSVDILDTRKMKTLVSDAPYSGCRYILRFDMHHYDPNSIKVRVENDTIIVTAAQEEEDKFGHVYRREYCRKLERPREVDADKITSSLTKDQVLIVEAPLPPNTLNSKHKYLSSPSHSHHSSPHQSSGHHSHHSHLSHSPSHHSMRSLKSPRSRSPSNHSHCGLTPSSSWTSLKINQPVFTGPNAERRMFMFLDIGFTFAASDITVHVLKDTRLTVKARKEERSSDRLNKAKFSKEFELQERIDPYSLRAGLTASGKLLIGALGKSHNPEHKEQAAKALWDEINANSTPCGVLDLSSFPPSNPKN